MNTCYPSEWLSLGIAVGMAAIYASDWLLLRMARWRLRVWKGIADEMEQMADEERDRAGWRGDE